MSKQVITQSPEQTQSLAVDLLSNLNTNIITLVGDLGSGKTTLTQGLGHALNIKRMLSPTYTLIRRYSIDSALVPSIKHLYHIDLYRLTHQQEALDLGLVEIVSDKTNLVVIEWPELVMDLLPNNYLTITIDKLPDNTRKITISS